MSTHPPSPPSAPAFLSYSPVALAFGTSGLRGLVKDITDLETYINVKGTLHYLVEVGDIAQGSTIALAGDLRPSTDRIARAAVRAIVDSGAAVEYAGKIPTPALIAHCLLTGRAGVMVTGSHIPFDRNGIKINKRVGEVLKSDEPGILAAVERVRAEEYGRSAAETAFDATGMLRDAPMLPAVSWLAEEEYVARYVDSFAAGGLAGRRIVMYQHSAVGRDLVPRILRALGAEVIPAGRSDTFIPIDTENITDEELAKMESLVAAHLPVDAIVSTDGDSDRPLVVAVSPAGRARFLPGDLLGLVTAQYLGAGSAVVPISANDAVDARLGERGIALHKSKIGSPYVIALMNQLAKAHSTRVVGWEANGGFLTGSDLTVAHGTLRALPTRDSILPILANLYAARDAGVDLATLWDRLPQRFGRAGLLDQVPVVVGRAILRELAPADAIDAALVARFFSPADGFGQAIGVDTLDGVRLYFDNGDVAHVRPSGNAPQLRIYANSNTQARADEIVAVALREPDGILRALERAFS